GIAIKVYMDDNKNPIINTTDSSLAGPGKVGLIHVSGTGGNGDSYHNLRLQALGQSLSGVNAYTRITLNSTDPAQTPQVPNLTLPVVGEAPVISVNNQAKTIGLKGVDIGKDFYYALGSTSLAQDASGTLLQPNVDSFTIEYTGQAVIDVVRDNTGGFPGTTTQ